MPLSRSKSVSANHYLNASFWKSWFHLVFLAVTPLMVAQPQEPFTRSTFDCISLYWFSDDNGPCEVRYRAQGGMEWNRAQNLYFDNISGTRLENQYRGSIVGLDSGKTYEIKLTTLAGEAYVYASTWSDHFKIKKTIRVGDRYEPLLTTEGGSKEEGYVLYDGTGSTIDAKGRFYNNVRIRHNYVIIRGFRCINASMGAIKATGAYHHVVIDRCEITNWGRFRKDGGDVQWGEADHGIEIGFDCRQWVVQGCEIHHPRYSAVKWQADPDFRWGHPTGPIAIYIANEDNRDSWEANHVIRFNAIYGDEKHMFDDAIAGYENFSLTGVPGADSDIYGNRISHAWDDLIEADGGGQNVRIWGNYLEYGMVPVSFQSLTVGPVYFFRNVFAGSHHALGVESSPAGQHAPWTLFKNNTRKDDGIFNADWVGPLFVYHNTSLLADGKGWPLAFRTTGYDNHQIVSRNNVFMTETYYVADLGAAEFVDCSFDFDLYNGEVRGDVPVGPNGFQALARWRKGHGPLSGHSGRYQLREGSPGHNAGQYLPNFNLGSDEPGGAPDMGAHEGGTAHMRFGPDALEARL